jgi:hypothetical protein
MAAESAITTIAHVIQLAVAPVFLLSGIGALLAVLSNRLSRIVDRAGFVEGAIEPSLAVRLCGPPGRSFRHGVAVRLEVRRAAGTGAANGQSPARRVDESRSLASEEHWEETPLA